MTPADKVLRAVDTMPGCTASDLQSLTGIPSPKINQIIQNARRAGEIVSKKVGGRACYWIAVNYSEHRIDPDLIIAALQKAGCEMQGKDVAKAVGVNGYKIRHRMGELLQAGTVGKRVNNHGSVFWRPLAEGEAPEYADRPPVSGAQADSFLRSVRWKPAKSMTEFLVSLSGVHGRSSPSVNGSSRRCPDPSAVLIVSAFNE